MKFKLFLIYFNLFLAQNFLSAEISELNHFFVLKENIVELNTDELFILEHHEQLSLVDYRPSPVFKIFHLKENKNKKLTAALLAFPLPFGIVGLHRIYLGCPPYVPVAYIASFGGVLGLVPLIDFCFILLDKKTEKYIDNKKVFMWAD